MGTRVVTLCTGSLGGTLTAQDLGPNFRKIKNGIYVQSAREVHSNSGIGNRAGNPIPLVEPAEQVR